MDTDPDRDGGRGLYCMQEKYWQDGCEGAGIDWRLPEWEYKTAVYDPEKCKIVFWGYCQKYLVWVNPDERDDYVTDEMKARQHNGGGHEGWRKLDTLEYWRLVHQAMAMGGE